MPKAVRPPVAHDQAESPEGTLATIGLVGDFDVARTAELRDTILDGCRHEAQTFVDLTDVTFMDSSALRALLEVRNELHRRGSALTLANPSPVTRRLFEVTNMAQLFGLDGSR